MTVLANWFTEDWYSTVKCDLCGHAHVVAALLRGGYMRQLRQAILDVERADGERFRTTMATFHCPGFGHPERAEGDILVAYAVVDQGRPIDRQRRV